MEGRPILQDKLREVWARVLKTDLIYRRMYETRHTFASWALAAGETPEWVARTLGHVDTSMVYKTYWPLYSQPHKAGRLRLRETVYGGRK